VRGEAAVAEMLDRARREAAARRQRQ